MKFSELNPDITGGYNTELPPPLDNYHSIKFDCPICHQKICINAKLNQEPNEKFGLFKWSYPLNANALNLYDLISIEPSIKNHPIGKNWKPCNAHFTITKGEVILN